MKQKLHILFLCGWYPSRVLPTNGDFIQRHAEAVATEHSVSVLHIISDKTVSKTEYEVFEKNHVKTHIAYVKKSSNVFSKLQNFYKAYKNLIAKIGGFDIVHLNTLYPFGILALHLKWLKKKPYIISEHWTGYLKPQSKNIGSFQKRISKIITKNAVFVCPVSQDLAKNMKSLGLTGNYHPVPNVVDTNIFFPAKEEKKNFTILHVSNMKNAQKNVKGIISVIQELNNKIHNLNAVLIGENSSKYASHANGLAITFIDQIPQKELVKYYQNSDVLVLFSSAETQSCVALEAIACGIPVIATQIKSIEEYLSIDYGTLIPIGNEKKLLEALMSIYNKEKSFASKENMHAFIHKNYSIKRISNEFSELYYKALKKK